MTMARLVAGQELVVMRRAVLAMMLTLASNTRADSNGTTIHDPTMLAGGVAIAVFGGTLLLTGTTLLSLLASTCSGWVCPVDRDTAIGVGIPAVIAGGLALLGGVGLAMEGGRHVRASISLVPSPHGATIVVRF